MAGDYLHWQFQHTRRILDEFILTTTDYTTASPRLTVKSANHRIYIQKICVAVTTYAAKVWTFQDSSGTAVPIGLMSIPAAAAALPSESGTIVYDFGPTGVALTLGKSFSILMSATGAAGIVHVEAYEKLEGAVAMASTNS